MKFNAYLFLALLGASQAAAPLTASNPLGRGTISIGAAGLLQAGPDSDYGYSGSLALDSPV